MLIANDELHLWVDMSLIDKGLAVSAFVMPSPVGVGCSSLYVSADKSGKSQYDLQAMQAVRDFDGLALAFAECRQAIDRKIAVT